MLKKGLKMHHMVQKMPWPSGKAKICSTSIPGPNPRRSVAEGGLPGGFFDLLVSKMGEQVQYNICCLQIVIEKD